MESTWKELYSDRKVGRGEWQTKVLSCNAYTDVTQLLLDHGADSDAQDNYHEHTPLLLASQKGHCIIYLFLSSHFFARAHFCRNTRIKTIGRGVARHDKRNLVGDGDDAG